MDQVRVPDEWPRKKKIRFIALCFFVIATFLLFNI
jgi:hypothetical protein